MRPRVHWPSDVEAGPHSGSRFLRPRLATEFSRGVLDKFHTPGLLRTSRLRCATLVSEVSRWFLQGEADFLGFFEHN